ncbi:MAG TPA: isoprenylcysteine carboxylmethyltransferase family protein [Xanthomonadaceae bacterium]|jgi:protein-S-isoprenylcysteine O-methyltransferase|nr:isoprenylcysteine carboxylmethyltransferase family protein [Xanthomonadaceae bacterium]
MDLPSSNVIAVSFLAIEATISLTRRPLPNAQGKDRGTFQLIWIAITVAIVLGIWAGIAMPGARLPAAAAIYPAGFALFVLGVGVRLWSIWTLGRFFTVQVAIASDHRLIENGPYRLLRHPSYTGSLMMFVGYLVCFGNLLTMAIVLIAVLAVFVRRIHVEEAALADAFGDAWRDYARRTWRLVPFVY